VLLDFVSFLLLLLLLLLLLRHSVSLARQESVPVRTTAGSVFFCRRSMEDRHHQQPTKMRHRTEKVRREQYAAIDAR